MNLIRARLKITSQSWIASIILVLNLVKLTGIALYCLSFSAWQALFYIVKRRIQLKNTMEYKNEPFWNRPQNGLLTNLSFSF